MLNYKRMLTLNPFLKKTAKNAKKLSFPDKFL